VTPYPNPLPPRTRLSVRRWTFDVGRSTFSFLLCSLFAFLALAGCRTVTPTSLTVPAASVPATGMPAATSPAQPAQPLVTAYPWEPSHRRIWKRDLAVLPYAEFQDDKVTVHNVRNTDYITESDYLLRYDNRSYDLDEVEAVYFVVVPFAETPALAHTMLSFGFADGRYLGISVEVRLEEHESYSPVLGAMRQFEIMYVVADERDLVLLRTEHRKCDVYVHKARVTPEQARALFVDMLRRVNDIHQRPEFYDTITNNCTTNIVRHINQLAPGKIPNDYRVLLPGYSDELAYELGLLDTSLSLDETRRRARITDLAHQHKDDPDFSNKIRGAALR
jgi:hypothetical protein